MCQKWGWNDAMKEIAKALLFEYWSKATAWGYVEAHRISIVSFLLHYLSYIDHVMDREMDSNLYTVPSPSQSWPMFPTVWSWWLHRCRWMALVSCVAVLEDGCCLYGFHEHRHHHYGDEKAISLFARRCCSRGHGVNSFGGYAPLDWRRGKREHWLQSNGEREKFIPLWL